MAVTMEVKQGFIGLVTNIAESQAAPGALRKAENVVIRRPGAIEPRPAFQYFSKGWSSAALGNINKVLSYDGHDIFLGYRPGTSDYRIGKVASSTDATDADGNRLGMFREDMRLAHAVTRGNLYLASESGVFKAESHADIAAASLELAGFPPCVAQFSIGAFDQAPNAALSDGATVGYRFVVVREDSNGLIVKSAPSGAVYVTNSDGATRAVLIGLAYDTGAASFSGFTRVEVYRTREYASGTVDEEYALVGEIRRDEFSGGQVNFVDNTAQSDRGEALYTSPSREGATLANDRPPACGCMESYRGCLFFGNTAGSRRVVVSYRYGESLAGSADGVGLREYTGDVTSGTNTITGMSGTDGIEEGQAVTGGGLFPAGTFVAGVSGTTVTTSQNATGTSASALVVFGDSILVNGTVRVDPDEGSSADGDVIAYLVTPPKGGYDRTLVIEALRRGSAQSLSIQATHGGDYDVGLPTFAEAAMDAELDAFPNGLMWSKQDEPEHVPLAYFTRVGDAKNAILALKATRDALFIFKEDGIWRLTGSSPLGYGWRIDPFDLTTYCVLPSSVVCINNAIYTLSNKGIVRVTDAGVQVISGPIDDEVRKLVYHVQANHATDGYYSIDGVEGDAGCANERHSEYVLLVGEVMDSLHGALVYNTLTDAWTTWRAPQVLSKSGGGTLARVTTFAWSNVTHGMVAGTTFGGNTLLSFMRVVEPSTTESFTGLSLPIRYEFFQNDSISALDAAAINAGQPVALSSSIYIEVDDVVVDSSGVAWRVASIDENDDVVLAGPSGATFPTGTATLLRPTRCSIQPSAFVQPAFATKAWTQVLAGFTKLVGAAVLHHVSSGALQLQAEAAQRVSTPMKASAASGYTKYFLGGVFKHLVGREFARSWMLRSEIQFVLPFGDAILEMVSASAVVPSPNSPQGSSAT